MSVNVSRTPFERNRIGRRAGGAAFASAVAASLVLLSSAPASAGVYGPYVYKNQSYGGCLTSSSTMVGIAARCDRTSTQQKWKVTTFPSGFVTLKNVSTGKCIDVDLDKRIYMNACNNSNYQSFYEVKTSATVRRYKPAHHAAYCLGVNMSGGSNQTGTIVIETCGRDADWLQEKVK